MLWVYSFLYIILYYFLFNPIFFLFFFLSYFSYNYFFGQKVLKYKFFEKFKVKRFVLLFVILNFIFSNCAILFLINYSTLEFIRILVIPLYIHTALITVKVSIFNWIFIWLTNFIFLISVLTAWSSIKYKSNSFFFLLFILNNILIFLFLVDDILIFYILFEALLPPMYLLIGIWGLRQRRSYAAYLFFLYTAVGSFAMLFGLWFIYVYVTVFDMSTLLLIDWGSFEYILWWCLFLAFAIKIPIFPTHIWLPEAHVEAPTVGSIILAGILLKVGSYAILKYLLVLCPLATYYYSPLVLTLGILGILYTSLITIRQIDLKKIIAYASVGHMNYILIGLFIPDIVAYAGSIYLMIGHGIVSSALFFLVGCLYERYHTRLVMYYSGLATSMPVFCVFFFLFCLGNISFPGTSNFVGEFLILLACINYNYLITFISVISLLFGVIYSVWLFNRLAFGYINYNIYFHDLNYRESSICFLLLFFMCLFGLFSIYLLGALEYALYDLMILIQIRK